MRAPEGGGASPRPGGERAELEARLHAAEEALDAIRRGNVDALVLDGVPGRLLTLRATEMPFRAMLEVLHEGTATVAPDGELLYANGCFAEMLRVPREKLLGRRLCEFAEDRDRPRLERLRRDARLCAVRAEFDLVAGDGARVPTQLSFAPLPADWASGTTVMVATDLRDRRGAEEVLRAAALAQSILDAAAEPILLVDSTGAAVSTNRRARRLLGRDPLGEAFERAFPLTDDSGPLSFARLVSAASKERVEARLRLDEAEVRDMLVGVAPLARSEGGRAGYVVTLVDVTHQKRIEAALAEKAHELERSNHDLQQFAYVASHDLQEPVRMVGSFAELLEMRCAAQLDDVAREHLRYLREGAHRMRELIRAVLEYSSVGGGRGAVSEVPADVALDQALRNLADTIGRAAVRVEREPLPEVRADRRQLVQLFQNLVGNAVKFRSGDGPWVRISSRRESREWHFEVRDNGIGIAPGQTAQLFALFRRLHPRDRYPGTGIGLAICKRIVERHGGRIWVESAPGEGSAFRFTLPA